MTAVSSRMDFAKSIKLVCVANFSTIGHISLYAVL